MRRIILIISLFVTSFYLDCSGQYFYSLLGKSTGGVVINYATWDAANKGTYIALSGTPALTETSSGVGSVRATKYVAAGTKRYWEVTVGTTGAYAYNQVIGIDNGSGNLSEYTGQDANAWGLYGGGGAAGNVLHAGAFVGSGYTTGYNYLQVIGIALDLVGWTIQFYINGVAAGAAISIPSGTNYYPAAGSGGGTMIGTANFGQSAFAYSVPTGFTGGVY